jgi:hypothetical protein
MVNWLKQISVPATTTTDIFAGDVMNWIIQYHDDIDLAAGDPNGIVSIATETRFTSSKFVMWDFNKDHFITITSPNYAENKTLNLPSTMATTDEIVLEDTGAQLTNKTIPVNLNALNHSTTNAAGDILKGNGTSLQILPRGSANQVLAVNAGGTDIAWAAAAGDVLLNANQTLTTKTINATNNTITDTSIALGDLFASNGTKFVRRPKGTGLQVLRTNSGATDIEWATLDNERVGKSTASGNASTTVFNIAHGVGANPTYAFVNCSSLVNTFTYVTNSTNIVVTFTTAPPTGTNNVIIYWRVVA